jgi:pimeloyl-ACP methyl ester carboxylesterase
LIEKITGQPLVLVGHSLGGWVTAAVAAQQPELVSKAVLVEPYSGSHSEVRKRERAQRQERQARREQLIRSAITPSDLVPAVRAEYAEASEDSIERLARMWFELDPVLETVISELPDGEETFADMFSAIQCPTLIIQGATDKGGILSDEESDRIAGLIPDSRILRWSRVGHSPHIARNHDFIRALKRFHTE